MEQSLKIYIACTSALKNDDVFEEKLKLVQKQRRAKVLRCKQKQDKERALGAGLLLRYALMQQGVSYETAVFETDECGKLYLASQPDLHFNISHSGEYAVCAISPYEVGVDIECFVNRFAEGDGRKRMSSIAKKCFTEKEREWFLALQEEQQAEAFALIWTRKEAYAKACGEGIRMDFSGIDTLHDELFFGKRMGQYQISAFISAEEPVKPDVSSVLIEEVTF